MGTAADAKTANWFGPRRFAALLGLMLAVSYPHVLFGGDSFIYRDFGYFGYPLAHYHREAFWSGRIPLWNPLNTCGIPFLAQWNTMVLYPGSLFYLLLPLSWSLSAFTLLHLFFGGMGMYQLARRWCKNDWAGCIAGTAFVFNGLAMNCLLWPNNSVALGWMPWVIWLGVEAFQLGGRRLVTASLAAAMQMLSGAPEIILFTWIILGVLCVGECFNSPTKLRIIGRFAVLGLLVFALCGAQLFPFLELLAHSQRHRDTGSGFWSMPVWGWANFLVPLFFTYPLSNEVRFQYDQLWVSSYYVSIGALLLALASLFATHVPRRKILWGICIAGLLLALGPSAKIYTLIKSVVPIFGFVRFPIKFVVLAVFALPIIAASAIGNIRTDKKFSGIVVVLLVAMAGIVVFAKLHPQYSPPFDDWPRTLRSALQSSLFLIIFAGVLFACTRAQKPAAWQFAILGLIWIDGLCHTPSPTPTASRNALLPGLVQLNPQPSLGNSRAMMGKEAFDKLFETTLASDTYTNFVLNRLALNCNVNLLDGISKVDGFYSLNPREIEGIRGVLYGSDKPPEKLLDFLGVSQTTMPGKVTEWTTRTNFLPMITAGQRAVFGDEAAIYRTVRSVAINPTEKVYLDESLRTTVRATNNTTARVIGEKFEGEHISFSVQTDAPSMVVIAQTHYPAWKAFIDGKPVPLLRANYAFQALEVPGNCKVDLRYEDRAFRGGAVLSAIGLIVCGVLWRRWRPSL